MTRRPPMPRLIEPKPRPFNPKRFPVAERGAPEDANRPGPSWWVGLDRAAFDAAVLEHAQVLDSRQFTMPDYAGRRQEAS